MNLDPAPSTSAWSANSGHPASHEKQKDDVCFGPKVMAFRTCQKSQFSLLAQYYFFALKQNEACWLCCAFRAGSTSNFSSDRTLQAPFTTALNQLHCRAARSKPSARTAGDVHLARGALEAGRVGVGAEGVDQVVSAALLVEDHEGHLLPEGPVEQSVVVAPHHGEEQTDVRSLPCMGIDHKPRVKKMCMEVWGRTKERQNKKEVWGVLVMMPLHDFSEMNRVQFQVPPSNVQVLSKKHFSHKKLSWNGKRNPESTKILTHAIPI